MTDQRDLLGGGVDATDTEMMAHLDDPEIRHKWPQALAGFLDVATDGLIRSGREKADATNAAIIAVRSLARYQGGRMFYLPKGDALEKALRDYQIWNEFRGRNQDELATKYRLTVVQIYSILREQRALHRKKVQPGLL